MYSEKTFKNYIFWIQVKRVVLIIIFSCIGAALGAGISAITQNILKISQYTNIIVAVSTTIFFVISLLLTSGTGKEVQEGYWKIALLRKLTVIQKNLEANNELLAKASKGQKIPEKIIEESKELGKKIIDVEREIVFENKNTETIVDKCESDEIEEDEEIEGADIQAEQDNVSAEIEEKPKRKMKTLKMPEEISG